MNAACFEAAIPEPFRILGLDLKPLSLGRYRLMRRFNVAFVADGDATADFGDLILGVIICSMEVGEFLEWVKSGKMRGEIRRWARELYPAPWMGRIPWIGPRWRKRHAFNPIEKMGLFRHYIDQASALPAYWSESTDEGQSATHWSECVEVGLRSQLGWSREEIDEAPLQKAILDFFLLMESNGSIRLIAEDELELGQANAEIFAKAFAGSGQAAKN